MSLRFRLSVLVAVAVAPSLALTAYNSYAWRDFLQDEAGKEALASARLVSAELAQLMEGSRRLMLTLMKHPAVPGGEQECTVYFKSVIADLPIYREAAFIDRDAKFHCSTIPIPPTLDVRDRVYFREPLDRGLFTIGTLTVGRVTGQSSIHVSMPYRDDNKHVNGVVVLILNPEKIAQEFTARPWPANQRIMVFDREGSVVLSIHGEGGAETASRDKQIFERARDAPGSAFTTESAPGQQEIVGFVSLNEPPAGLVVAVAINRELALVQINAMFWRSAVIGLIAIILAILGVWLATHVLIRRPVLRMVETARQREAGNIAAHFPSLSASSELGVLSTALAGMSDKVDRLIEQKEFLLRELQHRVMNSLNILSSLLMLQSKHANQPAVREQLSRAQERVLAMGAVYRHLYSIETTGKVDFGELLKLVCRESERAYVGASRPTITCEVERLEVSGSQATSLAVLAHELITNALKHAYPEEASGPISVRLRRNTDLSTELSVTDRGRGVPSGLDTEKTNSLGFKVIMATVRQFGGAFTISRLDPGTEFLIRFPPNFSAQAHAPDAA